MSLCVLVAYLNYHCQLKAMFENGRVFFGKFNKLKIAKGGVTLFLFQFIMLFYLMLKYSDR